MQTHHWIVAFTAALGLMACGKGKPGSEHADAPAASVGATQSEVAPIEVTGVRLEVTNPSISPDDRVDRVWVLEGSAVEGFDALIAELLSQTKVNDRITLGEYVHLVEARDQAALAELRAHAPPANVPLDGASRRELSLLRGGQEIFEFDWDMAYSGALVDELEQLVVKRGTLSETRPAKLDEREPVEPE
ncbi:hypothetical protein [Enhygromyxa salina]|nr:hypothetical protein [Enhygromyxa salina]